VAYELKQNWYDPKGRAYKDKSTQQAKATAKKKAANKASASSERSSRKGGGGSFPKERPSSHPDLGQYLKDMTPEGVDLSFLNADAEAAVDPLAELMAMIDAAVGGGGGGAPSVAFDSSPFDAAEAKARESASMGSDEIRNAYAALRDKLGMQNVDLAQQLQGNRASMVAEQQTSTAGLKAGQEDLAAKLRAQGVDVASLLGGFEAEGQARLQGNEAQASTRLALADRLAQVAGQTARDRESDAGLAESSALSHTQSNLSNLLGQIGLQRSQAESAVARENANRAASSASKGLSPLEAAEMKYKYGQDAADTEVKRLQEITKMAEAAQTTSKADFEKSYGALTEKYPVATGAFEMILKEAGKGDMGRAKALRILQRDAAKLTNPKDPEGPGKKLDLAKLRSWIEQYYDETPRLPAELAAQLGQMGLR
jgi:hypothetical protein